MRFWNASDACCNFHGLAVDDVAYLDAILDDATRRAPVDPARIYIAGYSNGGFMAHRYACERAARLAAIAAFSGDPWKDATLCKPTRAGERAPGSRRDADEVVPYAGGRLVRRPQRSTPRSSRKRARSRR